MERTFLCDVSFYQDAESTPYKPDFIKLKDAGIKGIVLRHSQNAYLDRMFEWYWAEKIAHNIPACVYGLLQYWPGSVDSGLQGKFIGDWFKNRQKKIRGWCDFERPRADYAVLPPRQNCLDMIQNWMDKVDEGTGMESGLYTNFTTIAYLSPIPAWLAKRPFWLSWPPNIPNTSTAIEYTRNMSLPVTSFTNLMMWQFAWNGPGILAGMESLGLDVDWFMGSLEEWITFCGETTIPIPPTPPVENIKKELQTLVLELGTLVEKLPNPS